MASKFHRFGTGAGTGLWPVLGLLLLAILAPTACLLWFLTEAVRNENMAVRQKLTDVFDSQLRSLQPVIQRFWDNRIKLLATPGKSATADEDFARLFQSGMADSYLLFDNAGRLIYPTASHTGHLPDSTVAESMAAAEQLEYAQDKPDVAASAYAKIAATSGDVHIQAQILQAKVRCLAKSGQQSEALRIIMTALDDPTYGSARDNNGRLIVSDVQLFGLELMESKTQPEYAALRDRLAERVRRYGPPAVPSSQRIFLMEKLRAIDNTLSFPTLPAEQLAERCLQLQSPPATVR